MSTNFSLLLGRAPSFLVYIGAAIFCIIYWRRAPRGALFAVLGIAVLLLGNLVSVAMNIWMMQSRSGPSATPAVALGQIAMIFGIANMILHAAGVALLVTGVFAGRETFEPAGFEVQPRRMQ